MQFHPANRRAIRERATLLSTPCRRRRARAIAGFVLSALSTRRRRFRTNPQGTCRIPPANTPALEYRAKPSGVVLALDRRGEDANAQPRAGRSCGHRRQQRCAKLHGLIFSRLTAYSQGTREKLLGPGRESEAYPGQRRFLLLSAAHTTGRPTRLSIGLP